MFALVVELRVKPEMLQRFLEAVAENSTASVRDEPGCSRFDVVQDNDDPHHFFFYEIYADEAAFQEHRTTPHFADWRQAAAVCLEEDGGQRNASCTTLFPRPYR
jgi:autoinducer 2-degrading protein